MQNPAFRNSAFQAGRGASAVTAAATAENLQAVYDLPAAEREVRDPMTVQDTLAKTGLAFAVLVAGAVIGWALTAGAIAGTLPAAFAFVWLGAGLVALVLGLVNAFKREPSPALILVYAAAEGVLVGGISKYYDAQWSGIVLQAVLATLAVVGVTLFLFASGRIRASKRATKIFLIAMVGYLVFSLLNVALMLTGVVTDPFGLRAGWIGIAIGLFAVVMGAYSLVLDFDFIQQGVRNQAPRKYGWTGAFGVMVTVVWLYLEILRLLAIARN